MKKQIIQLSVVVCVLVICILGYFIIKGQFDKKNEEKENQGKTTVFTLDDYKNTKKFSELDYMFKQMAIAFEIWYNLPDKNVNSSHREINQAIVESKMSEWQQSI